MSTGLMSCVRENSPPLEMTGGGGVGGGNESSSGAISLPGNASDQQKQRRRFHPLRNLRRIFRRRTLTAVDTITTTVQSVSSPSSPSTSQLLSSSMTTTPTVIQSTVPAHNLPTILPYSGKNPSPAGIDVTTTMSSTAYPPSSSHLTSLSGGNREIVGMVGIRNNERVDYGGGGGGGIGIGGNNNRTLSDRYGGVAVMLPFSTSASTASGGFYNLQETNSNSDGGREQHSDRILLKEEDPGNDDLDDAREMTDYQRSFSEGRLVDSDFSREALSQSHDSVFSESATASSLSIVLKAELFDVLRKRRNRPDASDEDLGLPRSPTTPQRKDQTINNQSEVSSLSLLSMASSDLDDESSSNYGNCIGSASASGTGSGSTNANASGTSSIGLTDKTSSSISSKLSSQDTSKTSDELDFDIAAGTRLSHSAARHKMAIRPKKKGPTRHRRPIESSVLPTTPEVNEDMLKAPSLDLRDTSVSKHNVIETTNEISSSQIKRAKVEKTTMLTATSSNKVTTKNCSEDYVICSSTTSTLEKKDEGFFRRLLHRNSKKAKKQQDEIDHEIDEHVKHEKPEEYSQKIEETREEIRKEILSEAKCSLSAMLNTFILSPDHERDPEHDREQEYERELFSKVHKPKSGPAARQRIMPKDLSSSPLPESRHTEKSSSTILQGIQTEELSQSRHRLKNSPDIQESPVKYFKFSNEAISSNFEAIQTKNESCRGSEMIFEKQSTEKLNESSKMLKSYTDESFKSHSNYRESSEHFEKKERTQPKIVGLSPFQQKISRAEVSTLDHGRPVPKQRKSVEKSKSFRYYSEGNDNQVENNLKKHENIPSLPDLSFSRQKVGDYFAESDFMPLSLSFEINDNNLLNQHWHDEQLPLSQSIYTKNIILTTSKPSPVTPKPVINPCNQNITEIEENIDKLVKSPFVTVLRKSTSNGEQIEAKSNGINISTASVRKTEAVINEKEEKTEKMIEKPIKTATTAATVEVPATVATTVTDSSYKILSGDTKAVSTENLTKIEFRSKDRVGSIDSIDRKPMEKLESTDSLISKAEMRNKDRKSMSASSSLNMIKSRRNSSVLEKFEYTNNQIPEFMKIQLNRVDAAKAKSNVVLAKNMKESEDKEIIRRFSSENVEISDNKPPLPPNEMPFSSSKRYSTSTSTSTAATTTTTTTTTSSSQRGLDNTPKSPGYRKVDEENNILRNSENTQSNQTFYERKKSVTDEKLKYEKKIEELRSEWKRSYSEENEGNRTSTDRRKISTDEETGVVLRKKSFALNSQSSNNKEDTPELMKVFARRSLKLKDDEMQTFEELEKANSLKKLSKNLDSDKENQSSSEEKLDKLPKVEIMIQQQKSVPSNCNNKIEDKNRNSSLNDLLRKPNNTVITSSTPTKSYISPIRYSSIVGYRNQTNFNGKPSMSTQTITNQSSSSAVSEPNNNNIINTNNIIGNNGLINNNNNNNTINNNGLHKRGLRHTIGTTTTTTHNLTSSSSSSSTTITTTNSSILDQSETNSDVGEFKGILQRRAEWEKRAKEALK